MSAAPSRPACAVVVAHFGNHPQVRTTVGSVQGPGGLPAVVLDVDGDYQPVADERVLRLPELAGTTARRHRLAQAASTLEDDQWTFFLQVAAAEQLLAEGADAVVVASAGILVVGDLAVLATESTMAVVPTRAHSPADVAEGGSRADEVLRARSLRPLLGTPVRSQRLSRHLFTLGPGADVEALIRLASDWLGGLDRFDGFALAQGASVHPGVLADPVVTREPGQDVGQAPRAVDLTGMVGSGLWFASPRQQPAGRPATAPLATQVLDELEGWAAGSRVGDPGRVSGFRRRFTGPLLAEARRAALAGADCPDPLGDGTAVETWAAELLVPSHRWPVARYLMGVWSPRPGLREALPRVPGPDSVRLARWALEHGPAESASRGYDPELLRAAAEATLRAQPDPVPKARPRGVNVVGYLTGELGLGVSARLMRRALASADVATSVFDVSYSLQSRGQASYDAGHQTAYDVSLLSVNGAETAAVARQLSDVVDGTLRIGMWYWEFEHFPEVNGAFEHIDEVWAATDFIRDAIAATRPGVTVRTVTPPLPQREGDPGPLPDRFGIDDDRPWFLFTFDYLSRAARKNPLGLIEAFQRAFPPDAERRPQLVIKTINDDKAAADALAVRLYAATDPDVILVSEYLPDAERHVLVAHCTAFVSLHKAEGLGLTLAEAMAWGKPVVTTRYGGPLQFCDESNALLVDWSYGEVPYTTGPYEQGMRWAEPDLDHAARLMRVVVEEPERARSLGEKGARDIATRHDVAAAGKRIAAALEVARADHRSREQQVPSEPPAADRAASAPPASAALPRRSSRRSSWRVWLSGRASR